MPRINKIRVANIKYDYNKKQMPDITIEPGGLDTILLLGNGGGKSLLIQLALQTVLPNAKMGKRRISDLLVGDSYTGHVAVEWTLDREGEAEHYLVTGFCFTEGYGENPLRYYNYLFDYDRESDLSLAKLPFIKDSDLFSRKYPIQYQELKDWLRDHKDKRVEIFEVNKNYYNRLKRYRILPEEWENIRDTNASEGGVDEFFSRSRDAEQLVDNLLIPGVEKMMFQDEDKQKKLFQAFSEYRNLLLEIPKIEANIKDFEVISERAEELVAAVRELGNLSENFEERTLDLVRLGKTFSYHRQQAEEELQQLEKKKQQLENKLTELNWKEESYKVFLQKLEYEAAVGRKEDREKEFQKQQELVEKLGKKKDKLEAFSYFKKLQQVEAELQKYKYRLEIINNSAPKLKKKLTALSRELLTAWNRRNTDLKGTCEKRKQKIASLEDEINNIDTRIENLELEREQYQDRRARLNAWFNGYYEKKQDLKKELTEGEVLESAAALKQYQNNLQDLDHKEQQTKTELKQIEHRKEKLVAEIINWNEEKSDCEHEIENIETKLEQFDNDREAVQGRLARRRKYYNSLLQNRDEVLLFCRQELQQAREKRARCQAEIANLEEKWALFADRDYYVPHHELVRVKKLLEERNIYTVLGSEWLSHQDLTSAEKEAYIKHQPLLPYSILIEKGQKNRVKHILEQNDDLSRDIPLLFIIRNEENLSQTGKAEKFLDFVTDRIYLFQPESSEVFVSQTAFEKFKDKLEEEKENKNSLLKDYKEKENLAAELNSSAAEFFRNYSEEQIENLRDEMEEYQRQLSELEENINDAKDMQTDLKQKQQQLEHRIEELQDRQQQLERTVSKLSEFVAKEEMRPAQKEKLKEVEHKMQQLSQKKKNLGEKKNELQEQRLEEKQRLNEDNQALEEHQQDYNSYQLQEVSPAEKIDRSYHQLKNEVDQVNDRLDRKQGQRKEVKALVDNYSRQSRELQQQIEETCFSQDWLSENSRQVTREELKEVEEKLNRARQQEQQLKEKLIEARSEVKSAEKSWQDKAAQVREKYIRDPYLEFSAAEAESEYEYLKEKLKQLGEDLTRAEEDINEREEWQRVNFDMLEDVKYYLREEYVSRKHQVERMDEEEWQDYDLRPKVIFRRWREKREEVKDTLEEQKHSVDNQFQSYLRRLQDTKNVKVKQFTRKVKQIMDNERLYEYDYVETQFLRILEGLEQYQKYYQQQLEEREKDMEHLTDLCLRRAATVYDSVMEIPRNSRIDLYDRRLQVIKMEWEIAGEGEAREKIYEYLSQVLADLQHWKEEGRDDDEIDNKMEEMLRTRNLIDVIAPLENCRVRVFKPRSEQIVRNNQLDYADWSEVSRWSGGEEYSIYITMFMIMISHIRAQVEGRGDVWKAIIADNPFGKASSSHILKTVFEVARSNRIQLVCFTAHRQDNILKEFPVVYSLQLRSAYGKEVMQAEKLETGFYKMEETV